MPQSCSDCRIPSRVNSTDIIWDTRNSLCVFWLYRGQTSWGSQSYNERHGISLQGNLFYLALGETNGNRFSQTGICTEIINAFTRNILIGLMDKNSQRYPIFIQATVAYGDRTQYSQTTMDINSTVKMNVIFSFGNQVFHNHKILAHPLPLSQMLCHISFFSCTLIFPSHCNQPSFTVE